MFVRYEAHFRSNDRNSGLQNLVTTAGLNSKGGKIRTTKIPNFLGVRFPTGFREKIRSKSYKTALKNSKTFKYGAKGSFPRELILGCKGNERPGAGHDT